MIKIIKDAGILKLIKNIDKEVLIKNNKNIYLKKDINKKCRNKYKLTKIISKEVNLLADF